MITDFKQSMTFTIVFSMMTLVLGGFYTQKIPSWLTWAKYLSPISYSYNILTRVEFEYAEKDFRLAIILIVFYSVWKILPLSNSPGELPQKFPPRELLPGEFSLYIMIYFYQIYCTAITILE